MAEQLKDWPAERFIDVALSRLPAPKHPETGEQMWERGVRLQGNQAKLLKTRARYRQGRGGWRAGKSFTPALAIYLDLGWRETVTGITDDLYGVIGDSYMMAEEEMRHLHWALSAAEIPHDFHTPEKQSWRITFPHKGAEVRTLTAADVTKIASRPYRGLVLAEAAQLSEAAYTNAKGRVLQTRGWVWIEGTFEDAGSWFYALATDWEVPGAEGETFALPSWENQVIFPGGRNDPAILAAEKEFPPDVFMEKLGGEPQKRSNLVMRFADLKTHVRHRFPRLGLSFDPELPVTLLGDPGTSHAYAVGAAQLVQPAPGWNHDTWLIDVVYRWGRTTEEIVEECAARPWAPNVERMVMDFAGRQHRSEGPPNTVQWARLWKEKTGHHLFIHAEPVPLRAGYDAHKRLLLNSWDEREAMRLFNPDGKLRRVTSENGPRLFIAPEASPSLFGGFVDGRRYGGEYNEHVNKKNSQGVIMSDDPIDIDNDIIKALNYYAYWQYGPVGDRTRMRGFQSMPWEFVAAS